MLFVVGWHYRQISFFSVNVPFSWLQGYKVLWSWKKPGDVDWFEVGGPARAMTLHPLVRPNKINKETVIRLWRMFSTLLFAISHVSH